MNLGTERTAGSAELPDGLFALALLSLLAGAAAGLIGAVFRLLLDQADRFLVAVRNLGVAIHQE